MRSVNHILTALLLLTATQTSAQGWRIYKNNGSIVDYAYEEVDSIVPFMSPSEGAEAIDLGLPSGTKWASYNLGASSPKDYGDYFAWGETETKSDYSWSTYAPGGSAVTSKEACGTSVDLIYQTQGGANTDIARTQYDVVKAQWGSKWKMPTYAQMKELFDNCSWSQTTLNGVWGFKLSGPNGNSIFLPNAGCYNGTGRSNLGTAGYYWTSTLHTDVYTAVYLSFNSSSRSISKGYNRYVGLSIRPVLE